MPVQNKENHIARQKGIPYRDSAFNEPALGKETHDIPVIALSASAMPREIERGHAAGFKSYLTKPIKVKEVVSAITETIGETQ